MFVPAFHLFCAFTSAAGIDADAAPAERRAIIEALRTELDTATPEGRASGAQIGRFLSDLDQADGGALCPNVP